MIEIAIVEDSETDAQALLSHLKFYREESGEQFNLVRYRSAIDFLKDKKPYDLVFFDIMLQGMTGMEAAARLRKHNADIIIIFVTNMTSFAIKSYEVDALDYIVKPVSYKRVVLKLQKALGIIKAKQEKSIVIKDATDAGGGLIHISSNDIYYIEVRAHKLTYHTKSGIFNEIGTLSQKEEVLSGSNFARCNACYLVNLRHVFSFGGYSVVMANGDELKISQAKKKTFTNILTDYLGQGKC